MFKKYLALVFVGMCIATGCYAQYGASFFYHSKPITPEAILPFLPGMDAGDTVRPAFINLKDSVYRREVVTDTTRKGWFRCNIDYRANETGFIDYKIIGHTRDNKFVLLVYWNGGNYTK
jgi:hypothetical protein